MNKIYAAITATMVGLFVLFAPQTQAQARSICDTGFRGQPAYDRQCLTTGRPADARSLWFTTAEGRQGHERDDMVTRRSICKFAPKHGGIMRWAAEFVGDMTYDTYRNNRQVDTWVGQDAALDCAQMGYATSLRTVDVATLPKGDCWFEVDRRNVEPICKR